MVSFRKFFSILIMMAVILFMFQFTQVIKEQISDYDVNPYAAEEKLPDFGGQDQERSDRPPEGEDQSRGPIVYIGEESFRTASIVRQWCSYTKRDLAVWARVREDSWETQRRPEYILVDSAAVDYGKETGLLKAYADQGIHLIFLNLPDVSAVESNEMLKELLGIHHVQAEQVETEGIHLFGDFLLGGAYIYRPEREEDKKRQDLALTMPWYVTLSGTKTYMVGMLDELLKEEPAKNEYFPAVIWRNSYHDARVYAVNGEYMSGFTGLGILSGMVYETESYALYPVVNAQNLLLTDYPVFAEENAEAMERIYSRPPKAVQQDIIWPSLLSTVRRSGWKLTCFLSPQYEYLDEAEPSPENVRFYLQQFRESSAEAGLSLRRQAGISIREKLQKDAEFYASTGSAYRYTAACAALEDIPELRAGEEPYAADLKTVAFPASADRPLVFCEADGLTGQGIVGNMKSHTYSEDLRLRGIETALGYSNMQIDMHEVLWPESEQSHWEKLYEKVASNMDTYWKPFAGFEKTTLSESGRRLRLFQNLRYMDRREEDRIFLDVEQMEEESWFLLRTHGEKIGNIQGAEYEELEKDAYLLHVTEEHVEIGLEQNRGVLTYTMPDAKSD